MNGPEGAEEPQPDASPDRSPFAERVLREATRRGFTQAARSVVLGDGSAWIWNTARELFPDTTQILDRYHAKEALHRAAQAVFPSTGDGKPWVEQRCAELDGGRLRDLVHQLRPQPGSGPSRYPGEATIATATPTLPEQHRHHPSAGCIRLSVCVIL